MPIRDKRGSEKRFSIIELKVYRNMAWLQDKVAFISGAGLGIARAAACLSVQEGARIVIAELKPELGRATEQEVVHARPI